MPITSEVIGRITTVFPLHAAEYGCRGTMRNTRQQSSALTAG